MRRTIVVAASLGLLTATLVLLAVGGFVQFDDTSGFGSDEWNLSLGIVAVFTAAASLAVSFADRTARRALGATLGVLDLALLVQGIANDGFRFIWHAGEGELFYFQVGLGLGAFALLTRSLFASTPADEEPRPARGLSPWARGVGYLCALVLAMFAAFWAGTYHFISTNCSGPDFDGECDLAGLEGLLWVAATFVVGGVLIVVVEVLRSKRQPRTTPVERP